jgi:ABC-type branched-subunit amino acid transport system substrate-binding protein
MVAALAIALVMAACGSSVSNSSGSAGSSSAGSSSGGSASASCPTPGYDAATKTFTVAALEPLSGPIGVAGQAIVAGMRLYFQQLNAKGGIDGQYKVTFNPQDSQYNAQVAVPIFDRIQNSTAIFAGILGTPVVNALLPQIKADNIPTVVDSSSASLDHQTNLLPWGTSAQVNFINEASYAAKKLGYQKAKFCSINTPDASGADNQEGDEYAAHKLGLNLGVEVQPSPTTTDFTPYVQQLQKAGCKVVMFGLITAYLPGTMAAAEQLGYDPEWMGQNDTYTPQFAASPIAGYLEQHYLTALIGVPWESSAPGMVALRAAVKQFAPTTPPSSYTELGYAHAMFVAAVLQKAIAAKNETRAGIIQATQQLGNFSYGGILPTYGYTSASTRAAPAVTGIYKVDPKESMGLQPVDPHYSDPIAATYRYTGAGTN